MHNRENDLLEQMSSQERQFWNQEDYRAMPLVHLALRNAMSSSSIPSASDQDVHHLLKLRQNVEETHPTIIDLNAAKLAVGSLDGCSDP